MLLLRASQGLKSEVKSHISITNQLSLLDIPDSPVAYHLGNELLNLLTTGRRLGDVAEVRQGLANGEDNRFLRYTWEVLTVSEQWVAFTKGGGYRKWFGQNWYHLRWDAIGQTILATQGNHLPSRSFYFSPGWSYSLMSRGSVGVRVFDYLGCIGHKGPGIYSDNRSLSAFVQSHAVAFILRAISPQLAFEVNTINLVPIPETRTGDIIEISRLAENLKKVLVSNYPIERNFLGWILFT